MPPHADYPNLIVFDHPLIQHKITVLRDESTGFRRFRALMGQIAGLMTFELTRTFPAEPCRVRTPMQECEGVRIRAQITLVPVLRAGLGMTDGVLELMPEARVGHIGLFRDERTLQPVQYLSKLPANLDAGPVVLVDPMLATGGSASKALTMLREAGATDLRMLCLVAVPEGVRVLAEDHPEVTIYAAALDDGLNDVGFILPGLGDAGDRLFGTG
ncbi:MAG: uracil phosphoribosyltransferase [Planctomycetota bacterium]